MIRRGAALLTISTLPLLAHASPVYAATSDPPAGSPSGIVYQLPLQQGRSDAAPKDTGSGGGSEQSGGSTSLYRSENNFGSSSEIPGLPASDGTAKNGAGTGGTYPVQGVAGTGEDLTNGGSGKRNGVLTSQVAGIGNTSPAGNITLLIAIAGLATGLGVLSRRSSKRRKL